jgi:hypothetical protein
MLNMVMRHFKFYTVIFIFDFLILHYTHIIPNMLAKCKSL